MKRRPRVATNELIRSQRPEEASRATLDSFICNVCADRICGVELNFAVRD